MSLDVFSNPEVLTVLYRIKKMLCLSLPVLLVCWVLSGSANAYIATTNIGTLGGTSYAWAVNASGKVTGYSSYSMGPPRAVRWSNGTLDDLGPDGNTSQSSSGYGINVDGWVAGYSRVLATDPYTATVWLTDGTQKILGMPTSTGTGTVSQGYAINSNRQVVGNFDYTSSTKHAGLWNLDASGNVTSSMDLAGFYYDSMANNSVSYAYDINDAGVIAGYSKYRYVVTGITYTANHACLWKVNDGVSSITNLGGIDGQDAATSYAYAVNPTGTKVVGYSNHSSGGASVSHACLWNLADSGAGPTVSSCVDLGSISPSYASYANDINASGVIVGYAYNGIANRACMWNLKNGVPTLTDLNTLVTPGSGWTLLHAYSINDSHQIVGDGGYSGVTRGFVMTFVIGDANYDGTVNGADLTTVLSNYNQTGTSWTEGDFNGDGTVNDADLTTVLSNYNQTASISAVVPEPATLSLLAAGLVGLLAYAWKKRT